jgi:hypothetical protein
MEASGQFVQPLIADPVISCDVAKPDVEVGPRSIEE